MNQASLLATASVSDVDKATALYNESLTYLRLASDHAKFMRNYSDPTQEQIFRTADTFAQQLDSLRSQLCGLQEPVAPQAVNDFVHQAVPVVAQLIAFKDQLANMIDACQTQHLLPGNFIRHLRREADFFLGTVGHVMGTPTPTRERLDMPGPAQERVATIARTLIDVLPMADVLAADLAYTEFWAKHEVEHADAIIMLLRPQQTDQIARVTQFRQQFAMLLQAAVDLTNNPTLSGFDSLDRATAALTNDWRNFLLGVEEAQRTCKIQTNFPQRLTEHIRIETDIMAEAAARAARRRLQPGMAPVVSAAQTGATFQTLTPKSIFCS